VPNRPLDVVKSYRDRMKTHRPIPPKIVQQGPVLENVDRDDGVNVLKFPVPFLHELDGGRYIGTDDLVIMRDPEVDWINAATYRSMVISANTVGLWMSPGKHGRQIREKYFREGKPCPVLMSCGHDPLLFLAGGNEIRFGLSEYDYAGGHRGLPFEVVPSELYGLPMPAHAEIVLEGEMWSSETALEGPFGEFTGYYASSQSPQPLVRVKRIYYRSDPILTMASPMRPPSTFSFQQMRDEVGNDLGRGRASRLIGCRGRVVSRIRRSAHVQRDRDQAGLCRPFEASGDACGELPVRFLPRPLRRGGGR
jgi:UbiD family decarboxylase